MSRNIRITLTCLSMALVVLYLVFVYAIIPRHEEEFMCSGIDIVIADSTNRKYTEVSTLMNRIKQDNLLPTGKPMELISTQAIEDCVLEYPILQKAVCYKTIDRRIHLDVWQRVPILRVATGENYFVDENRQVMPDLASVAAYVPIVTGRVSKPFAQGELFDFVQYIEHNSFWSAQIEQIHVVSQKQIELIPRIGNQVIILGDLIDYERKLSKLKTFYTEAMNKTGWTPYKEIDLRFHGQVVCRK